MTRTFNPEGTFLWVGISLIVYDFVSAWGAGCVFLFAVLASEWVAD